MTASAGRLRLPRVGDRREVVECPQFVGTQGLRADERARAIWTQVKVPQGPRYHAESADSRGEGIEVEPVEFGFPAPRLATRSAGRPRTIVDRNAASAS